MGILSKERFIETVKKKFKTEEVEISEGEFVIVSEMDSNDFLDLLDANKDEKGNLIAKSFLNSLLSSCIVDENFEPMFTEEEFKELRIPQTIVKKIGEVAKKLNGMTGDEKNELEAIPEDSSTGESQQD